METIKAISSRTSLKIQLSSQPVEQDKINQVLEAARLAPSARNLQPWYFVVITDKKIIEEVVTGAFSEGNQIAKQAPVMIVICADPNDDVIVAGKEYYLFDLGLAMENLLLAATDLGLVTHPMAGFSEGKLKGFLGIPETFRVAAITPLAYPISGSYTDSAQERLKQRSRKKLSEITYLNRWGKSLKAG